MPQLQTAKLLRIHISESDRSNGKPLYEVIVARCRELGIAGATVFRGLEGFGETAELHRPRLLHKDQPIAVVIIDTEEKMNTLIPAVEAMLDTGMMALSNVGVLRVEKGSQPR